MARGRDSRSTRREEAPGKHGNRSGLLTGLLVGLVLGLIVAAALAWYFNKSSATLKPVAQAPRPAPASTPAADKPAAPPPAARTPAPISPPDRAEPTAKPKPRVDLTFYDILPGDKPGKPTTTPKLPDPDAAKDMWWLQVAALRNAAEADRLKARLTLLGLHVVTQKLDSGGQALYRVRVGPYKREDDAFGDLDTLAENDFEPRLLKEPLKP